MTIEHPMQVIRDAAASSRRQPEAISGDLVAEAAAVTALRDAVGALARRHGARGRDLDDIALGVTEAAANVVRHAYPQNRPGRLHYVADVEGGELQVVIADDGPGIAGRFRSAGAGLGLQLIAGVTTDFSLTTQDMRGFEVWMRFVFETAPAG